MAQYPSDVRCMLITHSRTTAISSPMPKGVINFQEIPVTNDNASVGNHVVIASQYATHAFFRKYAGKTGMLAH